MTVKMRVQVDATFDVDDIDHALFVLARHFAALAKGDLDAGQRGPFRYGSTLRVAPVDSATWRRDPAGHRTSLGPG